MRLELTEPELRNAARKLHDLRNPGEAVPYPHLINEYMREIDRTLQVMQVIGEACDKRDDDATL